MIALTQKSGQRFTLNDSLVWYVEQLYVNNNPSLAEDGSRVVYKTGRQYTLTENLDDIQAKTWTTRWVRMTRLDNGMDFLAFRDLILQSTPVPGNPTQSDIEWVGSMSSKWRVSQSIDDLSAPPTIVGAVNLSEYVTNKIRVSKNGDDALAIANAITISGRTVYSQHYPFANPSVANTNAAVGDQIDLEPGIYTIGTGGDIDDDGLQQIAKNGVILNGLPGSEIHYINTDGTYSLPFTDGGSPADIKITGKCNFKFMRGLTGGDSMLCTTNAATTVDWEFSEMESARRFGGTGHNAASWRMVGRKYTNTAATMIFAFRYPVITIERNVYISFEETVIEGANLYTRAELSNFNGGSYCYANFGRVTYPTTYPAGGFFQVTSASSDSIINVYIESIHKTSDDAVKDYLLVHGVNEAKGKYVFNNINTCTGLGHCASLVIASSSTGKREEHYTGTIRSGFTGTLMALASYSRGGVSDITYNIKNNTTVANCGPIRIGYAPLTRYQGYLEWNNPLNTTVFEGVTTSPISAGTFNKFIISNINAATASFRNTSAPIITIKVFNSYATRALSVDNGGFSQIVDNFIIDPLV